jgi:hypothetical protein
MQDSLSLLTHQPSVDAAIAATTRWMAPGDAGKCSEAWQPLAPAAQIMVTHW